MALIGSVTDVTLFPMRTGVIEESTPAACSCEESGAESPELPPFEWSAGRVRSMLVTSESLARS